MGQQLLILQCCTIFFSALQTLSYLILWLPGDRCEYQAESKAFFLLSKCLANGSTKIWKHNLSILKVKGCKYRCHDESIRVVQVAEPSVILPREAVNLFLMCRSIQGQVGEGFEDLSSGKCPSPWQGDGTRWYLRSLPTRGMIHDSCC